LTITAFFYISEISPGSKEGLVKSPQNQFDPIAFLSKVGTGKTIMNYRKGRIIFAQGEEADKVFYIQSGKVKLTVVSEQGKEAIVGILEPAQFFGEGCLSGQAVRVGTARAMDECLITAITRRAMLATLRKEPKFSELFVAYLLTRNNRVEEDLIDQLFNSSEKRLASSSFARQFRKRWKANAHRCVDQSSDLGRNDRHDPVPGEFFPE
jgi:CRP/FNR family transcriptional regulator, cyclic AMP receptor protein